MSRTETPTVTLREVTADNWRAVDALRVADAQREFVSPTARSLCLCHYGGVWQPLAIYEDDEVVGFVMWAIDPDDGSGWIGGLTIDHSRQRRGLGRAALALLVAHLRDEQRVASCALSFTPDNVVARRLYASAGFVETGETEDDGAELVARLRFADR